MRRPGSRELRLTPGVLLGLFKGREGGRSESATMTARKKKTGERGKLTAEEISAGEEGAADIWQHLK
jgi:hypothetical protein